MLSECGIETAGSCTKKTVTIPDEFGEVYERYNELQKRQGFDLYRYRSREAVVYTFPVASVDGVHTDFTEGLAATIEWYRANEAWWYSSKETTEAKYAKVGQ